MKREERIKQLRWRIAGAMVVGTLLGTSAVVIGSTYRTLRAIDQIMSEPVPEEARYIRIIDEEIPAVKEIAPVQYDTMIPDEYIPYVLEIGQRYNICPELIMAVIETESGGNPDAVSESGCIGLMQIKPQFARGRMDKLGATDLYDPYSNILVGVDILVELADKYDDLPTVLMCYNKGEYSGAVERAEAGEYSGYATKIMQRTEELEKQAEK